MSAPKAQIIDLFEALRQSLDAAGCISNEAKVEQLRLRLVRLREDAEYAKGDYLTTCNEAPVAYSTEAVDAWFERVKKQRETWLKYETKAHEAWDEWADATTLVIPKVEVTP